jgi:PhnB protein
MAIKGLNPYLNFAGNAAQAIKLYEVALGAKRENLMRYGDVQGMDVAPEHKERVMHAHLKLGTGELMISDAPPGMQVPHESNTHVALHFDDPEELTRKFEALAADGQITMPLQDTFWGAKFGMLTDAFGIRWMFNCELKPR